jgi:hypothetical protein
MDAPREQQKIAGYDYGTNNVTKSPISLAQWEGVEKTALFSEEEESVCVFRKRRSGTAAYEYHAEAPSSRRKPSPKAPVREGIEQTNLRHGYADLRRHLP